jgi:uncharacterized repeat protein (TIGR04076 family)
MPDNYKLTAKVISQKGTCSAGHCVGDEFVLGEKTPENMCSWAFQTIFPFYSVLRFGGTFPWEKDRDKAVVACPDPDNPIVFEIQRIKE